MFSKVSYLLLSALLLSLQALAQKDSTRVVFSEESAETSDFRLVETYNYIIRAQIEEKSLLKLGVQDFALSSAGSYVQYGAAFEHKLRPSLSVLAEVQQSLQTRQFSGLKAYSFNAGARYYYNMNRRIRKGKSANNFSANYLSFQADNELYRRNDLVDHLTVFKVLYGLQRRIGKYGYADFNFGPERGWKDGSRITRFSVNFSVGVAF